MKNAFIAARRVKDPKTGKLWSEGDGDFYLELHPHKCLAGKEFTSPTELIQAVQDHQNKSIDKILLDQATALVNAGEDQAALAVLSGAKRESIGEVIILNVIEF